MLLSLPTLPCWEKGEAHFICAVLNSSPARSLISKSSIETQVSGKALEPLSIRSFSHDDPIHLLLADLSVRYHDAVNSQTEILADLQQELDGSVAKLWNIIHADLQNIRSTLHNP